MSGFELRLDPAPLRAAAARIGEMPKQAPAAIARALNHVGDHARTRMVPALVTQTGLKRRTIEKALRVKRARPAALIYRIDSQGGNVRLKYFGARETGAGVSAAPWNKRQVFARTWMKGGLFPNRVPLNKGGQVFVRTGTSRTPVEVVRSGLFIPTEMVAKETASAFFAVAETELAAELVRELVRVL